MNMKFFNQFLIAACAGLVACGGGGGGDKPQEALKVTSTNVFNLKAAYTSLVSTPFKVNFSASVTKSGVTAKGSGSITQGSAQSGTFENAAAQKVVTAVLGSISGNGNTVSLDSTSADYYDSNYNILGTDGTSSYRVVDASFNFPTSIKVGDTGELYTEKKYSSYTKSTLTGTTKVSFLVEADTATTALLSIISVVKDTNSIVTSQETVQYRISADNKLTPIKDTLNDYVNSLVWTMTF